MENQEQLTQVKKAERWFDKNYKLLMLIPIMVTIVCFVYLVIFYSQNQSFILKDVSLSGGTTITLNGNIDADKLQSALEQKYQGNFVLRKLTDVRSGQVLAVVVETPLDSNIVKADIESALGIQLTSENSSIEFTGSNLSNNFYNQLMIALLISFVLMSIVIFFLFKTFIPSIAVIFAAFSDIVMPLALLDFLGIRVSAAGIAAFWMLVGYSVETDI